MAAICFQAGPPRSAPSGETAQKIPELLAKTIGSRPDWGSMDKILNEFLTENYGKLDHLDHAPGVGLENNLPARGAFAFKVS